jgi:hypothetical protein
MKKIKAYSIKPGIVLTEPCPYCGREHQHTKPDGGKESRVAHCGKGQYRLVVENAPRRRTWEPTPLDVHTAIARICIRGDGWERKAVKEAEKFLQELKTEERQHLMRIAHISERYGFFAISEVILNAVENELDRQEREKEER